MRVAEFGDRVLLLSRKRPRACAGIGIRGGSVSATTGYLTSLVSMTHVPFTRLTIDSVRLSWRSARGYAAVEIKTKEAAMSRGLPGSYASRSALGHGLERPTVCRRPEKEN